MSLELFHLLVVVALIVLALGLGTLYVHYKCIVRATSRSRDRTG